jgi:hypothetical protein
VGAHLDVGAGGWRRVEGDAGEVEVDTLDLLRGHDGVARAVSVTGGGGGPGDRRGPFRGARADARDGRDGDVVDDR